MGKKKKKRRNKFSSPLSDLVDKPNQKFSNVDYEASHIIPTIKSQKQDKSFGLSNDSRVGATPTLLYH